MAELVVSVSEFVALLNQTLEFTYPSVTVVGELANFRVSKNKWIYFDLKDEQASVKFFGTVFQLPGPLEDGLMLEVRGMPRLHPQYGFAVTTQSIKPIGEGSLKRVATLLEIKLRAEGLFEQSRKRVLPYPPARIGLITSSEAAAYSDFVKVLNARWGGLEIDFIDVQVQGEAAAAQIVAAITRFNAAARPPEVIVVTRGGGSIDDLQAFNTEEVTRAIAASRVPTVVAIGHERDSSLAELAADQRASTPSNAAELLVPDRRHELAALRARQQELLSLLKQQANLVRQSLDVRRHALQENLTRTISQAKSYVSARRQLLQALAPEAILTRGYAIVRKENRVVCSGRGLKTGDTIDIQVVDATLATELNKITMIHRSI